MSTQLPERIGKYTISALLGRGAMGMVYKGFDPHIARPVAIKTIHRELLGTDEHASIAARFRNEAQAVGRLQHAGIVAIYEFGEVGSTAYIAMEYVEGSNLDQVLASTPMLPERQVQRIMVELLDALECAHRHGVWHRDIKPGNLILTRTGQVKLADFGIARIENQSLTQVASTIGTPGYMAPQQYTGEGVDHRADLFAAGVLLYRLLTGVQPFTGSPETLMYKILNEHPQPPSQVGPRELSGGYDDLLRKALAKGADERFQSAHDFRQALLAVGVQALASDADDATVIVARALQAAGPGRAPAPSAAPGMGALPSTPGAEQLVPTHWDAATLARIERALASHIGPMAKLLVRQAARQCTDVASLAAEVAQHIAQEPQRRSFISQASAGSGATPVAGISSSSGAAAAPGSASASVASGTRTVLASGAPAAEPVTPALLAHALAVLTRHLGPIARIVLKRAAEKARSRPELIQLLLDAATEVDRATLAKELQATP